MWQVVGLVKVAVSWQESGTTGDPTGPTFVCSVVSRWNPNPCLGKLRLLPQYRQFLPQPFQLGILLFQFGRLLF